MQYPALDVMGGNEDQLLAIVDDFSPTAIDERDGTVTIFFGDAAHRAAAHDALVRYLPSATIQARDVDDEDWARRSQENLAPIAVGRLLITPPWHADSQRDGTTTDGQPIVIVIAPSMGFGTGHHATTRLCLVALQELTLSGSRVLDAGTGSGILAIAARALGAREAIGIDTDSDAVMAAQENLDRNPQAGSVRLVVGDLRTVELPEADVLTANLTGALLVRAAELLQNAVRPGGVLIVSGLLRHERDDVIRAFSRASVTRESCEDEWVCLTFGRTAPARVPIP